MTPRQNTEKRAIIFSACVAVAAFLLFNAFSPHPTLVSRVIDGDTIVLENNERVRLLGIDTPETGQFFSKEAGDWLAWMIGGKEITLEPGDEDRDKYNRLLRHVWFNGKNINLELVKGGFASVYMMEPEDIHYQEFIQAETLAREAGLGIWKHPNSSFCIGIYRFRYNSVGNDNDNLNGEYVTFRNKCTHPVELTNWTVADNSTNTYLFPDFTLQNKSTVTLHTGQGQDNQTSLHWGKGRAVWNNQGDILTLKDSSGGLLLYYPYQ